MIKWLAGRVKTGHMTAMEGKETEERPLVPSRYRDKVIKELLKLGLDADGKPIAGDE